MEWVKIGLSVLGAVGGVISGVFMVVWRMSQKIEDQAHLLIMKTVEGLQKRQDEHQVSLNKFLETNHQLSTDLSLTRQDQLNLRATVTDLKETVNDLRGVIHEFTSVMQQMNRG